MNYVPGGADIIDIFAGGLPDEQTKHWFRQRRQALNETLSSTSRAFFEKARTLYQTISESQALQMLRNLRSKMENVWSSSMIEPLLTLERLQTANPIMQRWIMAEPMLRRKYLNQEVEGYSESYTNYHGNTVGDAHYDYRRVMNGVLQLPTSEDEDWVIRHYLDLMGEEERELTAQEKVDILSTWSIVRQLLEEGGEDPTSPYGAQL